MELSIDEQRLIAEFRKLTPAAKDELLAAAASLVRGDGGERSDDGNVSNQCKIKNRESLPEAEKTPISTE